MTHVERMWVQLQKAVRDGKIPREKILELYQQTVSDGAKDAVSFFNTHTELKNAPPVHFIIRDFMQNHGVMLLGGISGHNKTWVAGEICRGLLTKMENPNSVEKIFDYFEVLEPAHQIIYLTPELTGGQIYKRLGIGMNLDRFIESGKLLIRSLSIQDGTPATKLLRDRRLLSVIKNADVFCDTLPRFREGSESDVDGNQELASATFALLAEGARTVTALQHSTKAFEKEKVMTLESVIRGSSDIPAMASTAWGIRKVDEVKNLAYVQNVKPRDFEPPEPFLIRLRPDIDKRHRIGMEKPPGVCGSMWQEIEGPKDKKGFCRKLWEANRKVTRKTLQAELKNEFGAGVDNNLLSAWLSEFDQEITGAGRDPRLDDQELPFTPDADAPAF
jgi:hypothetical protein